MAVHRSKSLWIIVEDAVSLFYPPHIKTSGAVLLICTQCLRKYLSLYFIEVPLSSKDEEDESGHNAPGPECKSGN